MQLKEIVKFLENIVPVALQENYDNCGLIVGNTEANLNRALVCLDITDKVLQEAIDKDCKLIISHHPFLFQAIKKVSGNSLPERILVKAIKNDIAIYAMHTNVDNVSGGMNQLLAEKLKLKHTSILQPKKDALKKMVVFVPESHDADVRQALFNAGAGQIGNYDSCSFNVNGVGTFKGNEHSQPFVGKQEVLHQESEVRIEMIFPAYNESAIISALINVHPYEEVAYDIYALSNVWPSVGAGIVGDLEHPITEKDLLDELKKVFNIPVIKHSELLNKSVKRIAICGGSGSFLIKDAIQAKADVFITGDLKYHDFQIPDKRLVIADVGHFESEQFIKDWIYDSFSKKLPKFAILISEEEYNPVKYF